MICQDNVSVSCELLSSPCDSVHTLPDRVLGKSFTRTNLCSEQKRRISGQILT